MRKINYTHYVCEFCGKEYDDEKSAKKCEDFHKKPIKLIVDGFHYHERVLTGDRLLDFLDLENLNCHGFPNEIEVEDDYGNRACYQYKSIVEDNKKAKGKWLQF